MLCLAGPRTTLPDADRVARQVEGLILSVLSSARQPVRPGAGLDVPAVSHTGPGDTAKAALVLVQSPSAK